MSAARLPAWSSPNFLNTANGKANQRFRCWNRSILRRVPWMSMAPAHSAYPGRPGPKPPDLAVHGLGRTVPGNDDEADLSLLHHAQALPGDPLDVRGIVEPFDLLLELGVLLLQKLRLPLQLVQALSLRHVGAHGNCQIEEERRDDHRQHGRPGGEPDPTTGPSPRGDGRAAHEA